MGRYFLLAAMMVVAGAVRAEPGPSTTKPTVRVAAFGNINGHDLWKEVSERFEKQTGIHVDTVLGRDKDTGPEVFKKGGIDLITMESESADAMLRLEADGYLTEARPWIEEDLAIVGPSNDPAGIKGMTDAGAAIKKIITSKSPLLIHCSLGADQVIKTIVQAERNHLDPNAATILLDDHQKSVLNIAMGKHAYTMIARLPFIGGKFDHPDYDVMVEGDPILRRPVLAGVANPNKITGVHTAEARKLLQFLTSAETQEWLVSYGEGEIDAHPFFYAVAHIAPATQPANMILRITGELAHPMNLTAADLAKMKHQSHETKDKTGNDVAYSGVPLRELLKQAGAPLGDHQMRGPALSMCVSVRAADGYRVVFALADLDDEIMERSILLADSRDGSPLDQNEGPLRLLVPHEARPARAVRKVIQIDVQTAP